MKTPSLTTILLLASVITSFACGAKPALPNVVIIYADDMGYGDLNIQNPNSKIPTPYLDQLAREGMRFTDAHSSSGICSPSRYSLLTGRYHWRRQHNIVNSFGKPFFTKDDITLPQILQSSGYNTAAIGKWHLGWNWQFNNKPSGKLKSKKGMQRFYLPDDIDWNKAVTGGPLERGFNYYFGDGTINFPPYAWFENDKVVQAPNTVMTSKNIGFKVKEGDWEFRPGPKVAGWNPYDVLPTLTKKSVEWLSKQKKHQPFFLYLALPSPHAPIIPNKEFDDTSRAGAYGDFMVQTDWVAGQVLAALKKQGLEDNTIVIFTADNGPEKYAYQRVEKYGHYSSGDFRGLKRDVYEGGHHVPLVIKWPGKINAGAVSKEVISQVDIMATLAAITNTKLTKTSAPDSYDISSVLLNHKYSSPIREATVQNTKKGVYALRQGKWLYINHSTGQHTKAAKGYNQAHGFAEFNTDSLLFDLEEDPGQRNNLQAKYPEKASAMDGLLSKYRQQDYSVRR
ncbi:arylsulfatase [Thalassotalea fonticola]|uniref:Arylsulfatase n=1 Tax=Thalassotalea fonticola TaxID=3065649 RepID=A0ABZ0GUU7_9GAMM|nr:arylsulfatase [Colwelliaceae bacterium S1-1]